MVELKIDSKKKTPVAKQWHACMISQQRNKSEIEIYPACDSVIGDWTFSIETATDDKPLKYKSVEITILFNPWSKDDQCYYKDEKDLEEYILNPLGRQFKGSYRDYYSVPWEYGQFEKDILDICITLVEKAFNGTINSKMSDPVEVSRGITRMVNSSDGDQGVLQGKWGKPYTGGKKPSEFSKSDDILRDWKKSGYKPVKYAQCWVFSALTTAVCRAVGLPCRSVTCFSSAHDTDNDTIIDTYFGASGEDKHGDSIWNFHVWNECYFKRPDLGSGNQYDGWQVIDSTPQESSHGAYQCGPCPVAAVKEGDVQPENVRFDAKFVFAEVNADRFMFLKLSPYSTLLMDIMTDVVGREIVTKQINRIQGESVKHNYKYKEFSRKEHEAVLTARNGEYEFERMWKNIAVDILDPGAVMVGQDVEFNVKVEMLREQFNPNPELFTNPDERTIGLVVVGVRVETYTGRIEGSIKTDAFEKEFTLRPGQEKRIPLKLEAGEYEEHLTEDAMLSVVAIVRCNSGDMFVAENRFRFRRPDIEMEVPEKAKVGETVPVKLSFKNPLHRPLTDCVLYIDMSHSERQTIPESDVRPGQEWKENVKVTVKKEGWNLVTAIFSCDQLDDISYFSYIWAEE
ncbi:hypothetical protein KUTeg_019534 [Tegillarca granosa]|uniref:Transglutaminase-like domain-containing protein n=1 Tax=Tegillarca granosa TaxID=220873 RepID=A0ABQ9ECT5_TEGGR|nr:hypothetical protein KUTeg_019534 [Tegillarca granosa]